MSRWTSALRSRALRNTVLLFGFFALAACADGQMPGFLQPKADKGDENVARAASGDLALASVERDVEAPEVFQAKEAGLWDGRPSLGGVWVAHPDVKEPGRVIIRNEGNGQFVIGALFRRERETPGPRLQVSSDAAAAIGMLAGQPNNLNVVALKREEVKSAPAAPLDEPLSDAAMDTLPAAPEVAEGALDPVVAEGALDPVVSGASAAIETAALAPVQPLATPPAAPKPVAAAPVAPKPSKLSSPFIQIGIFSVEENANNTATAMRQAGMVPTVKQQSSAGKTFWRVIVGPAQDKGELNALLKKIKDKGFTDAYAVTN